MLCTRAGASSGAASPVAMSPDEMDDVAVRLRSPTERSKQRSLAKRLSMEFGFGDDDTELDFDMLETSQNAGELSSALSQLHLHTLPALRHVSYFACHFILVDKHVA